MNVLIYGMKLTAFMVMNVMMTWTEGCSQEEIVPIRQFAQDFILGWLAAFLF